MTDYISDYLDNATDTPKPSRKSRQDLAEHRHSQIEDGFLFPLHATSLGGELEWAQVRRLNVTETAVVEALPAHLQQTVFEGVKEFERLQQNQAKNTNGVGRTLKEMVANNQKGMKAANAFALAAFVDPRLAATEDDALAIEREQAGIDYGEDGPPPVWLMEQVSTEDRLLLFMACMDADSKAAGLLKPFRRQAGPELPYVAPRPATAATFTVMGSEPNPQG
jgi:hypothetical protein